ncbi:MAG: glutamate 5-kinase [Lachnospiraceae bacterium]
MKNSRKHLNDKKRIVVKIGSSSLIHESTGRLNLAKMEKLVRVLTDIKNTGKEVILVSSGAIAVGRTALGLDKRPDETAVKQACAAVGQAKIMMVYQKLFAEYSTVAAQILMTKTTVVNDVSRRNATNTFEELLKMGIIPIVNENDTVSTYEIEQLQTFGDNDRLSAIVTSITNADLLILLSDIDGLYTDDPNRNKNAKFVAEVENLDDVLDMGKGSSSDFGTGGMAAKLTAAEIATKSGADMVITNGDDLNNLYEILKGNEVGTCFFANPDESFELKNYI